MRDSCGRKEIGKTPPEEAYHSPAESEYIPFAVIERHIFFGYPKFNGGLYILVMWHTSTSCARNMGMCSRKATVRSGKHMHLLRSLYILCYKQQLFSMGSVIAVLPKNAIKKSLLHIERKPLLMIFFMIVLGKPFLGKADKFPCHL